MRWLEATAARVEAVTGDIERRGGGGRCGRRAASGRGGSAMGPAGPGGAVMWGSAPGDVVRPDWTRAAADVSGRPADVSGCGRREMD